MADFKKFVQAGQTAQSAIDKLVAGASTTPHKGPLLATSRMQYALIDAGLGQDLRYLWVEHVGASSRTMAGFFLATDAIEMRDYYQRREDAEAIRAALFDRG